jgi:hypothetical protein
MASISGRGLLPTWQTSGSLCNNLSALLLSHLSYPLKTSRQMPLGQQNPLCALTGDRPLISGAFREQGPYTADWVLTDSPHPVPQLFWMMK